MIKAFEGWSKLVKFLIIFFTLGYFSAVYRIVHHFELKSKNMTLIFGLLSLIPIVGFIGWIADLLSTLAHDKITLFIW